MSQIQTFFPKRFMVCLRTVLSSSFSPCSGRNVTNPFPKIVFSSWLSRWATFPKKKIKKIKELNLQAPPSKGGKKNHKNHIRMLCTSINFFWHPSFLHISLSLSLQVIKITFWFQRYLVMLRSVMRLYDYMIVCYLLKIYLRLLI